MLLVKCNNVSSDKKQDINAVADTAQINNLNKKALAVLQTSLDSTLLLAKKAGALSDKINYPKGKGDALANMATYYQNKGNYNTSLNYALQALQLFEASGNIDAEANNYVLMAQIYKEMAGNERTQIYTDKGIAYSENAFELFNSVNDSAGMVNSLSSKGTIFRDKGILLKNMVYYDSAYLSFKKAIAIVLNTGKGEPYLGKLYNNLSQVYIEQKKDYDSALIYLNQAVVFNEKKNNLVSLSYNYGNISEAFVHKKNNVLSLYYARKMLDAAIASKRPPRLTNAYRVMYKSFEKAGKYDSALFYYIKSVQLNDTLSNLAKTSQVSELQTKYETEKKELIIAQLDVANANKNKSITWLAAFLIVFIILAIGLIALYKRVQKQKVLLSKQADKLELMMKELHHRVKNNLQIVSSLLSLQTYKMHDIEGINALQASSQRVQAMSLIHQRLYKREELTSINIKEYITDLANSLLSSYGYELQDFDLIIHINDGLMDVDKALPLGLIANELITNALKYAYENVERPCLQISLIDTKLNTILSVKDNGKEFTEEKWKAKNDSFGKQLIVTLCKQLRAKQQINTDDGTEFIIEIIKKNSLIVVKDMSEKKLSVLIVEDEALVALDLSLGLQKDGYNIAGTADNAEDALQIFLENDVDIVLMDIKIIGLKDGIETAEQLLKHKKIPIIYVTAITDTATINRVKKTHPAAFLTKPYNISNIRIAIELAINEFAGKEKLINKPIVDNKDVNTDKEVFLQMNDCIFIKQNYRFVKQNLSEIIYAEADGNYINLITKETKIAIRLSLNLFMEKINFPKLVRIHRSFAVNVNSIQSFNEQEVTIDKKELPIGRNYRESFLKQFAHK